MKRILILVCCLSVLLAFLVYRGISAPKYKSYTIKKTRLIESVYASGYIDSVKGVTVKSEVSGMIERLFVKEGDFVKSGQVLALIKHDTLKANLNEIRAQLELLRERLREDSDFQMDLKHVVAIKRAIYENAEKGFLRQKGLYEEGLISKERFDMAIRDLEVSKRDLNRHENILKDSLKAIESQYNSLIQREKALLEEVQRHTIKSPISGKIMRRFIKEGDYVNTLNQTNEVFSIGNPEELETVLLIDEENAPYIKKGMKVIVSLDSFADEVFEGTIELIEGQSNRTSRLVKAKAKVDYRDKPIVLNMNVEANMVISEKEGIFVPVNAYRDGYVEVLEGGQKKTLKVEVDKRPIKGYYRVVSGLVEGQQVVLQ